MYSLRGNKGNDTINADGVKDNVNCGKGGDDTAKVDQQDTVAEAANTSTSPSGKAA